MSALNAIATALSVLILGALMGGGLFVLAMFGTRWGMGVGG